MRTLLLSLLWLLPSASADPSVLDRYSAPVLPATEATTDAPAPTGVAVDPFSWQADPAIVAPGGRGELVLRLVVPAGTHVYRDQIEVSVKEAGDLRVGDADLPPGLHKKDPGDPAAAERELYDTDVLIVVPVDAPKAAAGLVPVTFEVHHQGCKPGLCFSPKTTELQAFVRVTSE